MNNADESGPYRPIRWPFGLFVGLTVVAVLFVIVLLWLYRYRNDEYLAQFIMSGANPKIRGRVELGRVHWDAKALIHLAVGIPAPVVIDHFAVYDPREERVIYVPRASGNVDLLALVTRGHLLVYDVKATSGYCNVAESPLSRPGQMRVGLVEAFTAIRPAPGRGPRVELNDFDLSHIQLRLSFFAWSLELADISTRGSFVVTGGKVSTEGIRYDLSATAAKGELKIGEIKVPLRKVSLDRFQVTPENPMDLRFGTTVEAGGARVRADGVLAGIYRGRAGVDLQLATAGAGPLLAHLVGSFVGGRISVKSSIQGRLTRPLILADAKGIELDTGTFCVTEIRGRLRLQSEKQRLTMDGIEGRVLGGTFSAGISMDLETGDWSGELELLGVDPTPLDPLLAGRVQGSVKLKGQTGPSRRLLAVLDLSLERQRRGRADPLPTRVAIDGSLHLGTSIVDLAGLRLRGEGNMVQASGSVNLRSRHVNLHTRLSMPHLQRWLALRGHPPVVRAGDAALHVTGRFPALRATGEIEARGVGYADLRLGKVRGEVVFDGETLELKRLRAESHGGEVQGEATVSLFAGKVTSLRPVPLVQARLRASNIELAALGAAPHASGRLFAEVEVSGPFNELTGNASIRLPAFVLEGDPYEEGWARVGLLGDRISIYEGRLRRRAGGRLELWGDLFRDGRLGLRLGAEAFPLSGIPNLSGPPLSLQGELGGKVEISGTLKNPRLDGEVKLNGIRVRGVEMGSGVFHLSSGSDAVHILGSMLGKVMRIEGYMLTDPRPRVHLKVDVDRFPLEKLLQEVQQMGDVRGRVSGTVRLDLDTVEGLTWADARFPSLEVSLHYRLPGERRPRVVRLVNQEDLLARFDGRQLHVVTAKMVSRLEGQAGQQAQFTVGGWLSQDTSDIRLRGKVALEILEFFLEGQVKKLGGEVMADLRLTGSVADPVLKGGLTLSKISIQMPGFSPLIRIPRGQLRLVPGALRLDDLEIHVGNDKLRAAGELKLERFVPKTADLTLAGDVNIALLELFFGEQISHAAGAARVKLKIFGPVPDPRFSGLLGIRQAEISPRGWGRTITLTQGEVELSNYLVRTRQPLKGIYDEGLITLSGEVRLDRFDVVDIYLRINGVGIPQRQPKVYSAEVNMDLTLLGDSQQLLLKGEMELVDVRYIRKFDVLRQALVKPRIAEEETPFWKGSRVLENLRLNLLVRSIGQILVKNNLVELVLSGDFSILGTLSDPRLGGVIRAEEGTFKLPGMRGEFSISRGEIIFDKQRSVEDAEISMTCETLLEGRGQMDYQIRAKVEGKLNEPRIELTSTPTLDAGQIWALLVTGRTTDQLRAQLRGDQSGSSNQAAGVADAQVKQLTSDMLRNIVEDPLKKFTRLDLISLEVGTESAQIRAGKKLGRYINLGGEYELGMLGDSRAEGRMEIKMHDLLMLVGKWERLSTRLETEEQDPSRGRIELKLRLPLR